MNRIQEVLNEKGISQIRLAKALGIARSSVSQYCSNKVQPPINKLQEICNTLDCEINEVIVIQRKVK
jgi:putative transcriptional regulator